MLIGWQPSLSWNWLSFDAVEASYDLSVQVALLSHALWANQSDILRYCAALWGAAGVAQKTYGRVCHQRAAQATEL